MIRGSCLPRLRKWSDLPLVPWGSSLGMVRKIPEIGHEYGTELVGWEAHSVLVSLALLHMVNT